MKQRPLLYKFLFAATVFLVLGLLAAWGVYILRDTLLRNAQIAGTSVTRNLASEEHRRFTVFETMLRLGVASLNRVSRQNGPDRLDVFDHFHEEMRTVLGKEHVAIYVLRNGRVVHSHRNETVPDNFDASRRPWYRRVVEGGGGVVVTDIYRDLFSGRPVLTLAQRCGDSDTVLAMDIFPEDLAADFEGVKLQPGDSYFFADTSGRVLYANTDLDLPKARLDAYVGDLVRRIEAGEFRDHHSSIADDRGDNRVVYYSRLPNGWYSILTVPYRNILGNTDTLSTLLFLSIACFFAAIVLLLVRSLKDKARANRTAETVQVLGNSYFGLYRVDYSRNTYERIKSSADIADRLPARGSYDRLLQVVDSIVLPHHNKQFRLSFSMENIRRLVAQRKRDFSMDYQRRFGDVYRWVNVRLLFDETLAPQEVVLCFRDIEEEKQLQFKEERLLEDSLELSRQSLKARQNFFSHISHEMRTPLNGIIGMSDLALQNLERNAGDLQATRERNRHYLERINYASRQLKRLIDDVLELSRMEQGRFSLNNQPLDLAAHLRLCLAPYVIEAEVEGKTLVLDLDDAGEPVMADPLRVDQLMNNLVSNAFKFTEQGDTVSVSLELLGAEGSPKYKIVVSDTGRGMSPEFLPDLFTPYSRERKPTDKRVAGTGLGMAITRSLVEQMNGEINVRSDLGLGTTFTLIIPFAQVQDGQGDRAARTDQAESAGKSADSAESGRPARTDRGGGGPVSPAVEGTQEDAVSGKTEADEFACLAGRRVLVAEDNLVNMELTRELLSMHGVEVTEAWDGREALKAFESSEEGYFDAVLMDMQMPVMDGCEAASALRALKRRDAGLPLIAVTANAFAEDIAATTAAGMDAHISKPIDGRKLCEILARFLCAGPDRAGASSTDVLSHEGDGTAGQT